MAYYEGFRSVRAKNGKILPVRAAWMSEERDYQLPQRSERRSPIRCVGRQWVSSASSNPEVGFSNQPQCPCGSTCPIHRGLPWVKHQKKIPSLSSDLSNVALAKLEASPYPVLDSSSLTTASAGLTPQTTNDDGKRTTSSQLVIIL